MTVRGRKTPLSSADLDLPIPAPTLTDAEALLSVHPLQADQENSPSHRKNPKIGFRENQSDPSHLRAKWIGGIVLVIFFVAMIVVYSFIVLRYAWEFSRQHTLSGYLMCLGIVIIPFIGGYLVFNVIRFGIIHQRLAFLAAKQGFEPDIRSIRCTPSGRFVKSDADELFARIKTEWEQNPQSWTANYRLARAYDYAADRPRAREFMHRAVTLEKSARKVNLSDKSSA